MPDLSELEMRLSQMPSRQYSELIRNVEAKRRSVVQQRNRECPPHHAMSKDDFACWIGQQHFDIDKGISRILYLPKDAPAKEVRLLEVNELASIPDNAPIQAVDFRPDIDGIDFAVLVADVSPRQFELVMKRAVPLPAGWNLDGFVDLPRE